MITKVQQTKTGLIAEKLRQSILNGEFPDGRLPSKKDLISYFEVSHQTIDLVLKRLREEGLIRGVRGTGIFVNQQIPDVNNLTHRLVLILMPKYSIYETEPYDALRAEALRRGLFPINLNMPDPLDKISLQETASMTQLLRAPICGVIYMGRSYWRHPFLDQWKNLRSAGLIHFDADRLPPGSTIETDFFAAGYQLARHMIGKGAKKLLIYFSFIRSDVPKSAEYWERHPSTLMQQGAAKAAAEAGLPVPQKLFQQRRDDSDSANWDDEIKSISDGGADGIICGTDGLAYNLIAAAVERGIKVPEDLLVSGCYDNAWGNNFEYKITTVNINAEELSRKAFDCLAAGGVHRLKVTPKIIFRQSTNRK